MHVAVHFVDYGPSPKQKDAHRCIAPSWNYASNPIPLTAATLLFVCSDAAEILQHHPRCPRRKLTVAPFQKHQRR